MQVANGAKLVQFLWCYTYVMQAAIEERADETTDNDELTKAQEEAEAKLFTIQHRRERSR
jgi:hypothetical protein